MAEPPLRDRDRGLYLFVLEYTALHLSSLVSLPLEVHHGCCVRCWYCSSLTIAVLPRQLNLGCSGCCNACEGVGSARAEVMYLLHWQAAHREHRAAAVPILSAAHRTKGQQLAMALGQLIFGSMESKAGFVRIMCSLTYERVSTLQLHVSHWHFYRQYDAAAQSTAGAVSIPVMLFFQHCPGHLSKACALCLPCLWALCAAVGNNSVSARILCLCFARNILAPCRLRLCGAHAF